MDRRAHQPFDSRADIAEGPASQVRDLEIVAQKVIAIEPDQRIEVKEGLDTGGGHHHQSHEIGPRLRIGQAPGQGGQSPDKELEISSGERHPKPLGLLREQPGVAHVAVQGGLEVEEHEAELVDLAAEVLAGQAMRELVGDADEQDDEPGQNEGLNSVQAEDVLPDFMPV